MPQGEQLQSSSGSRPSFGRWYILGLICLLYLITYFDRVNIANAAPSISKEFSFDKITMGVIFSAFGWAYAMFQVPGGWLSERFGARATLTAVVGYWSVMTAATAAATGWLSFWVIRFLFGAGEAGAFPGATTAMQLWFPRRERGFVQGITHSASRAGAAIAPPIVVLIISTLGWRSVFYICGAVGFVWSLWWYLAYRNLPEEHGMVDQAELRAIRGVDDKGEVKAPPTGQKAGVPLVSAIVPAVVLGVLFVLGWFGWMYLLVGGIVLVGLIGMYISSYNPSWGALLRSPNMWAIMSAYFTYVYCLYFFLTWLPSYLVDTRHFSLTQMGWFGSLPLWAGVLGDTTGGLATDWLLRKTGSTKLARRLVAIVALLGCAAFIVPAALTENAYMAIVYLTGAGFFLECTIGPAWSVPMDCGGKHSGTVSGMMNMAGNIGAALSPLAFGWFFQRGDAQSPFLMTAALLVAGAAIWAFWLDPDRSVIEEKKDERVPIAAAAE